MAFSTWFARQNRSAGTYPVAARAVPADLSRISVRIISSNWTQAARTIALSVEVSLDNQQTWIPYGAATFAGGDVFMKDGVTPGFRQFDVLLDPNAYPTHLRASFVVAGGSINAGVDGEVA